VFYEDGHEACFGSAMDHCEMLRLSKKPWVLLTLMLF